MIFKNKYFVGGGVLFLGVVAAAIIFVTSDTEVVQATPGLPFGGPRIKTSFCTCLFTEIPGTSAVTFINYAGGSPTLTTLKYIPISTFLYRNFNVWGARYILGDYFPAPFPCMMQSGKICIPNPTVIPPPSGIINYMGTS